MMSKALDTSDDTKHTQQLFGSYENLAHLTEQTSFIYRFDAKSGQLISANRAALQLANLTPETLKTHSAALFDRTTDTFARAWTQALNAEFPQLSVSIQSPGSEKIHYLTGQFAPDADKLVISFIAAQASCTQTDPALTRGRIQAIDRAQAVIEFDLDGQVLSANQNFLDLVGYKLKEVIGQHHRMFCDQTFAHSSDYDVFWERLRNGEYFDSEYLRFGKNGKQIWIRASYCPVQNETGTIIRIVKYAMDISQTKAAFADFEGKVNAILRGQAVIEFDLNGMILTANQRFLETIGYALDEIVGKHHRLFCDKDYAQSASYAEFWTKLARGEVDRGEYKRLGKDGHEVWLQATYNPIFDPAGRVWKIVKYATDITLDKLRVVELQGKVNAIDRAQAIVEFDLNGNVITANAQLLTTMGYTLAEIKGRNHSMFCEASFAASTAYSDFWRQLRQGEFVIGEYKRLGKGGREVWLQATYNPIFDLNGKPFKVVKYAYDVTETKKRNADFEGKVNAIGRAQAVIEFNLQGEVVDANSNFLSLMGYSLDDVRNKHHRIFCDPTYADSDAYRVFWDKLGRGEFDSGVYKRVGKNGNEVWIRATYSPIFDLNGRPCKIVKFATDITESRLKNAEFEGRIKAIDRGQAVIEFDLDGKVINANENFLRVMGYSTREILGQHHSIFCAPDYTKSLEYRDFWLKLNRGEFHSGRFHRLGKFNRDVYIQATYSPIFNLNGEPIKVVKYASDITDQVALEQNLASKTAEMMIVVGDMTSSIDEISTIATSADTLASETQASAEQAKQALQIAISSIDLIENSSRQISEMTAESVREITTSTGAQQAHKPEVFVMMSAHLSSEDSARQIFGLMRIGICLIALPVRSVREVIPCPQALLPFPAMTDGVLGAVSVRGVTIPVFDIGHILHIQAGIESEKVIIILRSNGNLLGLRVDAVCGIVETQPSQLRKLAFGNNHAQQIVTHSFEYAGDSILLLDADRIAGLANIPMVEERLEAGHENSSGTAEPILLFGCHNLSFGIATRIVEAVTPVSSISTSVLQSQICLGEIDYQSKSIPVIDLLRFLGNKHSDTSRSYSNILIVRFPAEGLLGLAIDEVNEIVRPLAAKIAAITPLITTRDSLFRGSTTGLNSQKYMIFNEDSLLSDAALNGLSRLARSKSEDKPLSVNKNRAPAKGEAYLVYTAAGEQVTPLKQIVEILPYPDSIIELQNENAAMIGIFEYRGQIIPLFCLDAMMGCKTAIDLDSARILIVQDESNIVGFVVRLLHSIELGQNRDAQTTHAFSPTSHASNNGSGEVLSGPERRRRWADVEKLAFVQETYEPDMTVSLVARHHIIAPDQLFLWRKLAFETEKKFIRF
eukprot:gene17293-17483_t